MDTQKDNWKKDPASKKQLFMLFTLTKKDYRPDNLTKGEASELISKFKETKPKTNHITPEPKTYTTEKYKKSDSKMSDHLYKYLISETEVIMQIINGELGIKSTLVNDFNSNETYAFVGSGCGFAWVKFDGRSKIAAKYFGQDGIAYNTVQKYKQYIIDTQFSKELKDKYIKMGAPIQATLCQNMVINGEILSVAAQYVQEKYNVKKLYVQTRLD